jgi:hypothetical protein
MRKYLGTLMVAGVLGFFATPATAGTNKDESVTPATVAVQRVAVPSSGMPETAGMVLVGTALIGLAAAVRRAA